MKQCKKCKKTKLIKEFKKDGIYYARNCNECENKKNKTGE